MGTQSRYHAHHSPVQSVAFSSRDLAALLTAATFGSASAPAPVVGWLLPGESCSETSSSVGAGMRRCRAEGRATRRAQWKRFFCLDSLCWLLCLAGADLGDFGLSASPGATQAAWHPSAPSWYQCLQVPYHLSSVPKGTQEHFPLGSRVPAQISMYSYSKHHLFFAACCLHPLSVKTSFLTTVTLCLRFSGHLTGQLLHPHPTAGSTPKLFQFVQFVLKKCH